VEQSSRRVFQGKHNISGVLLLADSADQVPLVKAKILASDAADPQGRLIDDIVTMADFLRERARAGGQTPRPRDDSGAVDPGVIGDLPAAEQSRVREMIPPEALGIVEGKDLPLLLRRRFEEHDGRIGTPMYVKYKVGVSSPMATLSFEWRKRLTPWLSTTEPSCRPQAARRYSPKSFGP